MMSSLFLKTLYDKRWFMLGWSFIIALTAWLVMLFFPSLQNGFNIEQIAETLPQELQGFVGDVTSFRTVEGYLTTQLFDIRLPLFILIMALVLGLSLTANEEDRGLMRTMAATALSRGRILWEKWLAVVVIMGLAALATALGAYLGIVSINGPLNHQLIWQLTLMSWLFGITAASIPMMVGFATGSRALTMLIGLVVTMGSFILTSFGQAVEWLKEAEYASLMHYFNASQIAKDGLVLDHILVLGGITLTMLALGWLSFRFRNLR